MLKDYLQQGTLDGMEDARKSRHSTIEEEESVTSTPVRPIRTAMHTLSPPINANNSFPEVALKSSPPEMPTSLHFANLTLSDRTSKMDDDQESSWSFGDDENDTGNQLPVRNPFHQFGNTVDRLSPFPRSQTSSSLTTTPQRNGGDKDARSSIFDWSEQQPFEKSPANRSPPRPKTVHGKKDAENRGSRSVGRRAPSGIHARSQSVPSAPEADGKRSQVVTNKFGTWGVGSKGVTEDWNEDFDFDEGLPAVPVVGAGDEKRIDSGAMFVPKSIQEQQTNVLANITLLRDWGLLIEELKELRIRAASLDLLKGKYEPVWNTVDAMIDLADQESDETSLAPRSPPSSPTFDVDPFDEPFAPLPKARSPLPATVPEEGPAWDKQPHLLTPAENDPPRPTASPTRPRKDSEAVAKSVIEALQQKRNISDPTHGGRSSPTKKVPFDTATLRRIVPYVQELRDKVKRALREAEGLYNSPDMGNSLLIQEQEEEQERDEPPFSRIFREPPESPSGARRAARRGMAATDHVASDDGVNSTDELTARLKLMTVN